jgi:Ca2+/H+ antiporter, TMEM165/GDT1 family
MRRFGMRRIIGFILIAIIGVLVFGNIVMWLWNALMPVIFHLPIITFPQALGLLVLSKILFSSFRGGGPGRFRGGRIREKWMDMTPEEREKFKQEWGHRRCSPFEGSGERFESRGRGRQPFTEEKPSASE